jgi:hypothetical protein
MSFGILFDHWNVSYVMGPRQLTHSPARRHENLGTGPNTWKWYTEV